MWDENEVNDVYCCQMLGYWYQDQADEDGSTYIESMSAEVVIGSTSTEEGPGELSYEWSLDGDGAAPFYEEHVFFDAKTFKSAKALAGAMATVAATAMVFT